MLDLRNAFYPGNETQLTTQSDSIKAKLFSRVRILVIKCEDVSGNFLPGPWCGLMKNKWFFGVVTLKWHTDVAFRHVVSDFGIHAWSVYCLARSSKTALRSNLGVVLLLLDLLSQGLRYDASSLNSDFKVLVNGCWLFILCIWEGIQDCFFYKVGSQAVSLWSSLSWRSGTGRKWVAGMHSTSDSVAVRS